MKVIDVEAVYKTRDYILKRKMFKYLYCGKYVVFREV